MEIGFLKNLELGGINPLPPTRIYDFPITPANSN